jgi:hypothetical protein
MKRLVGTTFLVFYAAFTVVAISQHTAAYASTIARHSPTQSKSIRAASPYSPQVRILQEPYVGIQVRTTVALPDSGPTAVPPPSPRFEFDYKRFTPTRAPPTIL